jgi:aspartate racemase
MKTIGILGGMSAASTQTYYRQLCDLTRTRLGGLHSPQLLIRSLDFAPVADAQAVGDWATLGRLLNTEARALEAGGAQILLLATNTMHKLADEMMQGVGIPLLHIADATAQALRSAGLMRPGLMATAFTMEQEFYTGRLRAAGLDPLIPGAGDRATLHRIIYEELCQDRVTDASRRIFEAIAARLKADGADSLILGCTEVGMLLSGSNSPLPVFDTVAIHCAAAVEAAL